MAGSPESHPLRGNRGVGRQGIISRHELRHIGEHGLLGRFSSKRIDTHFFPRLWPALSLSLAASWYFRRISATSTVGAGTLMFIFSIVSTMICEMARLRNHLWSDGMTNHGASFVLHSRKTSS